MNKKHIHHFLSFLLVSLASCSTDKIEPSIVEINAEYLPVEDEQEQTFEIYELDYTIFGVDTVHFYQRETMNVLYVDSDSLYAIKSVATSETENGSFEDVSTESITIERNEVIENSNNVRHLIFELPLEQNLSFDINAYNLEDESNALVKTINSEVSITNFVESQTFSNTLEIEIENTNNIILSINHTKIYQKGKGLVYEINENLDQQPGEDPIGFKKLKIRR